MKASSTPLYIEITQDLASRIEGGEFRRGDKLPTEQQLTQQYHVSRVTIRQAVQQLAEKGYIKKVQGSGSHVLYSPQKLMMNRSAQILSYSEELRQRGKRASYRVITFELQDASAELCAHLDLQNETRVYYYERILSSDETPYCYEEGYMPYCYFPDLSATHLEHSKLDYVENIKGIEIDYSHQVVQAILPDDRMMHLLQLDERKPLLRNHHVTYAMSGKPIFFTINVFDTDAYQANYIKKRHHPSPTPR